MRWRIESPVEDENRPGGIDLGERSDEGVATSLEEPGRARFVMERAVSSLLTAWAFGNARSAGAPAAGDDIYPDIVNAVTALLCPLCKTVMGTLDMRGIHGCIRRPL